MSLLLEKKILLRHETFSHKCVGYKDLSRTNISNVFRIILRKEKLFCPKPPASLNEEKITQSYNQNIKILMFMQIYAKRRTHRLNFMTYALTKMNS